MCPLSLLSLICLPEEGLAQFSSSVTSVVKPSLTHCHPHVRDIGSISWLGTYLFHHYRISAFSVLCSQHLLQYLVLSVCWVNEYRVRDSPYSFCSFLFLYTAKGGREERMLFEDNVT